MTVGVIDRGPLSSIFLGMQARLQLAFPQALFHFDIMPARINEKVWLRTVKRTPFVGIGWSDASNKSGGPRFVGFGRFSVFLVVQNVTGEHGRLLGDAQGTGLFQVVSAAILVLNGFKVPDLSPNAPVGGTVGTCIVTGVSNAAAEWGEDNIAVAVVDVEVQGLELSIQSALVGEETIADLFNEIASSWVFADSAPDVAISDDYTFGASS